MSKPKKKRVEGPSLDDEEPIWEFIHDVVCNLQLHEDVDDELFRRYLDEKKEIKYTVQQLVDYFNKSMRPTLFKSDLPIEKILELYKTLEIEMTSHAEMMLETRYSVILRIDSDRVLRRYSFFSPMNKQQVPVPSAAKNPPKAPQHLPARPSLVAAASEAMERNRNNPNPIASRNLEMFEEFETDIWDHINRKSSRLSCNSLMSYDFWADMITRFPRMPVKSPGLLLKHFSENMLKNLWKQRLDPIFKLEVYKELKLPFKHQQKNWFSEKEGVEVDVSDDGFVVNWRMIDRQDSMEITERTCEASMFVSPNPPKRRIDTWVARSNSDIPKFPSTFAAPSPRRPRTPEPMPDEPDLSYDFPVHRQSSRPPSSIRDGIPRRQVFTLDEQIYAWNYIHSKIKDSERLGLDMVLPKGKVFWNEYVRKTDTTKTASSWNSHFRRQMIPNLQDIGLGREFILYLYRNIDIEVDEKLKGILERKFNAEIRVNQVRNVISWKFLDQSNHKEEDIEDASDSEDTPEIDDNPIYDTTVPLDSIEVMRREERNSTPSAVKTEPASSGNTTIRSDHNVPGTSAQHQTPRRSARIVAPEIGSPSRRNVDLEEYLEPHNIPKERQILRRSAVLPQNPTPSFLRKSPRMSLPQRVRAPQLTVQQPPISSDVFAESNAESVIVEKHPDESSTKDTIIDLNAFDTEYMNMAEFFATVKATLETHGDGAIDLMNEAVKEAFTPAHYDEEDVADEHMSNGICDAVESMALSRHNKRHLLGSGHDLVKAALDHCENKHVFKVRNELVPKILRTKIEQMKEKFDN